MKFKLTNEAKKLRKEIASGKNLSDESTEFQESFSSSDNFWYHTTHGCGFSIVEALVADQMQLEELRNAFELVQEFERLYFELALEM